LRIAYLALLAIGVLPARGIPAVPPQSNTSKPFVLHLNQPVDPNRLIVTTLLSGPQGGHSSYGMRLPQFQMRGPQDILIDTTLKGAPASSLRIVVYCPGYRFAWVEIPSLDGASANGIAIDLVPLGTLPFRGRVNLQSASSRSPITLHVEYDASMMVFNYFYKDFRGAGSFMSSRLEFATTTLGADGSFAVEIPDLLNDPAAARAPGTFTFFARTGLTTGHRVRPVGAASPWKGLTLQSSYPGEIVFEPESTGR
jgi:hypothetical protein